MKVLASQVSYTRAITELEGVFSHALFNILLLSS